MSGSNSWQQQFRKFLPLAAIFILLAIIGYFVGPKREQGSVETVEIELKTIPPLPQHPEIQVYFNHSRENVYSDPYREMKPRYGYDLEDLIIQEIKSATKTIDIAVQELNLPLIAQALADQHRAGVQVRFVTENTYNKDWSSVNPDDLDSRTRSKYESYVDLVDLNQDGTLSAQEIAERDIYAILNQAGVPYLDDTADGTKGSGLMHQKFVVVDGQRVVMGSANFTISGIHGDFGVEDSVGNVNHLMRIKSSEIAQVFTEEFNYMWGDGPGQAQDSLFGVQKPERPIFKFQVGDAKVGIHFSPTSRSLGYEETTNGAIAQYLSQAQSSVDLALFVFSDQGILNQLKALHDQAGVEVRGLFDPGFAFRDFSRSLDMWGLSLPKNCNVDPERIPWNPPSTSIGVPDLARSDKLHHKFGLIDVGTSNASVITGSHNWSAAANVSNDENIVVIQNPIVADHFAREFDYLLTGARLGPPKSLQEKVAAENDKCQKLASGELTIADLFPGDKVNVNTASLEELQSLPGIGPSLAQNIVDARPISSIQDFDEVKGIGPSKLAQLEHLVSW